MSLAATCKTSVTDKHVLVEILDDILGKGIAKIVDETPVIRGYSSNKQIEVALSGIKGMYGTAGYYKNKAGAYDLIYDSTDRNRLSKILPRKVGKNLVEPISQADARRKVMATVKGVRGRIYSENVEQDGIIRIKVKVNN